MKKVLALFLALLMLVCGTAMAENPTVESVLSNQDVDVPLNTTSTIFSIIPGDADFTWAIFRLENGEWSNATTSLDDLTPVAGSGTAAGGTIDVVWDYWYNGDYTAYDGGVEHKLVVNVGEENVATVNFFVNYFANHEFDRVSLLSWFEDTNGQLSTARLCWYPDNTANSFGPKVNGTWQTYSVVDLSVQGTQTYDLVAAGAWKIGTVYVTVDGDSVTVDYMMTEDVNTRDTWDDITVDSEYLNFFADADSIDLTAESSYAFGQTYSIAGDLGGDTVVCVVISNKVDYPSHSPYVTRFWPNVPANKAIVEAMNALLAQ